MKNFLAVILTLAIVALTLASCGDTKESGISYDQEYSRSLAGTQLNVYNWGEYISDGSEGTLDVIAEFEKLTGIDVNYSEYESNENMYSKLKSGGASYDIVIPSDYMIARLLDEGLLQKIDYANIPNYKNIDAKYKNIYFDPTNEYSVPYNVGLVGLIYNTTMVETAPDSWSVMWDKKYANNILMFNNSRDAFGIAQYLLGQDINTSNPADWRAAANKLIEQKPLIQSYVMDEVFIKMESDEAAIAPYYAGDYLSMKENNPNLAFVYPKEGTNIFVDSICIPTSSQNKEGAEMFINFLLEPQISLANAETICYATPNSAVLQMDEYTLKDSEILYPPDEIVANAQYFHNLDKDTLQLLATLWDEVKLSDN